MKILFSILILFVCAAQYQAQTKCDLTLPEAPSIFNFRLGMSPAEAQTILGKSFKIKVKKEGTFFQNFIEKPPPASLPNVRAVYLRFFERRLYQIEFFYAAAEGEANLNDFVARLSTALILKSELWTEKNGRNEIDCREFTIIADNVLNPRVELTDKSALSQFKQSQKDKK